MDLENLLKNCSIDEATCFLTSYIPMFYVEAERKTKDPLNSLINLKKVNERISSNSLKNYLDKVCILAADNLLKKNVFTLASFKLNNNLYLILDKLDFNNSNIFKNKLKENKKNFFKKLGKLNYIGICVTDIKNKTSKRISNEFLNLVTDFELQDIQRGFFNEKGFLMNVCGCEKVEGLTENSTSKMKVVFDVNKMEKSFKDYLKDSGYEMYYLHDEHRVYMNDFYFNAHKNYLNSMEA